jgi:hypothetical protein
MRVAQMTGTSLLGGALSTHAPLHQVAFGPHDTIVSAGFAPDGNALDVLVTTRAVNLWSMLVYHWPEFAAALGVITVTFCAMLLLRVWGRPQLRGALHCRRCNYCLSGSVSAQCPECGRPVRRPVLGQTRRRRAILPAMIAATVIIACAMPWTLGAPRISAANDWLHWPILATAMPSWSERLTPDCARCAAIGIVSVDLASGRAKWQLLSYNGFPRALTPDAQALISHDLVADTLTLVDRRSGRVRSTLHIEGSQTGGYRDSRIVAITSDSKCAYVDQISTGSAATRLIEWNFATGTSRVALTAPAVNNRPRLLELADGTRRFVERTFEGRFFRKDLLRVHEVGPDGVVSVRTFDVGHWAWQVFAAGTRNVLYLLHRSRVVRLDLSTGTRETWIEAPEGREIGWSATVHAASGLLVTTGERASSFGMPPGDANAVFFAFDLVSREVVGRFEHPTPAEFGSGDVLAVSRDGRFFVTRHAERDRGVGTRGLNEIAIFSLPEAKDPRSPGGRLE